MLQKVASVILLALRCHRGAAMVEYALLAALIAVVATVALRTIGTNVSAKFTVIATTV